MNKKALAKGVRFLEELRKLDPEIPPQQAVTLLFVALNEDQTMKELAERAGISQPSMSRNVAALGKEHRYGKPGFDVLEANEDPHERRRKIVKLTPKGRRVVQALSDILEGG